MSVIEYSDLLFEISQRLEELNVLDRLLFMCRGMLASGSEDNIQDVLSLFKELEEQNNLGTDRLEVMKVILKRFKEWSFFGKVKEFESKRKRYNGLLEQIIRMLDELNDVERLIAMCRGKISQESEGQIRDVRSLFKELENQNNLGYHRLDILKGILIETEKNDLLKEVEEFEERRNQEDELKRKEDEFERRKAQAVAVASSVGNKLIGALNIKTIFKAVTVFSTVELLSGWPSYDQLVTAVNTCVLPAGTSLVNLTDGCVCLTVQAETLSALTTLWNLYQDGTLEWRLYDLFVTDEVKERAGGETVEVNVTIEEQEYDEARLELINEAQEAASIGDGKRIRRNSDSDVYFRPKEEVPLSKLKHAQAELKFHKERIAVIGREITEQLSPEILEACGPEEKASFLKHREIWKGREVGEMNEKTDEPEMSQRPKAKLMDPGKFAFVQKYLEDVQDTRSMTTEASDSGLATHTAASELGTEEINETEKLRMKDLSRDVTQELTQRLQADGATMEKFHQFFGLKMGDRYSSAGLELTDVKELFPDTTVTMLKECFEALRLYDLAEILENVKPRSLRPALSPEQIEKLRKADDRPTKYHSNVAVLVVNHTVKGDIVERDDVKKIKTFFKDLNSRNEVAIISLASSQETHEVPRKMKQRKRKERDLQHVKESKRQYLECILQEKARLEKELEEVMQMKKGHEQRGSRLRLELSEVKELELGIRRFLENAAKEKEQEEGDIEKLKKLEREAMDEWIHNQEKFTCVAVFIISDNGLYTKAALEECVEKLALIPDHAKLVVSPYRWKSIAAKVPETLHVMYPDDGGLPVFTRMIEIFNKRWQTLDLISMMQELKRTAARAYRSTLPFLSKTVCLLFRHFRKRKRNIPFKWHVCLFGRGVVTDSKLASSIIVYRFR